MSEALERAIACHRRGDLAGARSAAEDGLRSNPADATLLHFLGMLESGAGNTGPAEEYLNRAREAAPNSLPIRISLARALHRLGRWESLLALAPITAGPLAEELARLQADALQRQGRWREAAELLRAQAQRNGGDPGLLAAAAAAFAEGAAYEEAEGAYRAVLAADPSFEPALLGLAGLLESLNRQSELGPVFAAAAVGGARPEAIAFGEALRQRDGGNPAEALVALGGAKSIIPPGTYYQMRGDLLDRLGRSDEAFAAFREMNEADAALQPGLRSEGAEYRAQLARQLGEVLQSGATAARDQRGSPAFLVGFPRSGTTLLDTFLMGHPDVQVHEERPFLDAAFAGPAGLPTQWTAEQLIEARERYWNALGREGERAGALQIDKSPLASGGAHLIHRLFPDAPFLFALRHPCDVVLSCFITRFRLNRGVGSFLDLRSAAEQYDAVMRLWTASRRTLPLRVHEVRYERLLADPEQELRSVTEFLGLPFAPAMLDHRTTARERGLISTPSHAQVAAPLSSRPSGRWRRYRAQLEEVLPILAPWCDHFGYTLDRQSTDG